MNLGISMVASACRNGQNVSDGQGQKFGKTRKDANLPVGQLLVKTVIRLSAFRSVRSHNYTIICLWTSDLSPTLVSSYIAVRSTTA